MPYQLTFELSLLNTVTSLTGTVATSGTNKGLAVSGGRQTESPNDDSFRQRVNLVEDIHKHQTFLFFKGNLAAKAAHPISTFSFFWGAFFA